MFSLRVPAILALRRSVIMPLAPRSFSTAHLSQGEQKIKTVLTEKFPKASIILVEDISGGCGAMYDVKIESVEFQGLRKVKQHMMVTEALRDEIKDMHGITIHTLVPK